MGQQFVEGFYFEDAGQGELAKKEAETVRYVRMITDLKKPEAVWKVYTKILDNNMFATPVGYSFLNELYGILAASGKINEKDIPKIPIIQYNKKDTHINNNESDIQNLQDSLADENGEQEGIFSENEARIIEEVRKRTENFRQTSETRVQQVRDAYRMKSRNYKVIIAMLALVIVGLLGLVFFSDNSPLVDAETRILDQYSAWSESLTEKEAELKQREDAVKQREEALTQN